MPCAQPHSNFLSMRNEMAICSYPATATVPHRTAFLLLAALLITTIACAADFSGPVVSVLDGDTIEILHHTRAERIRLNGIECPEKSRVW
jgi:endonuclease YncB( thermonuclease family)